jgi:para-nitrobenzyl esterase
MAMPLSNPAMAAEVETEQGILKGLDADDGGAVFLGVPFAAPPVGDLRWRPPQPAPAWNGVRQATSYGPACVQDRADYGGIFATNQSEDCLTLNIWTPAIKPSAAMPVMVYIHGGGFTGGAGSIPTFDGEALGKHGIVVVTINYRLGVFGFFSHPDLSRESARHTSGNYGLADQLAALRWIRQNISAFGGDPDRVTLFGQSAGSISVFNLMASRLSKGLFHRAIGESGTPLLLRYNARLSEAEARGGAFAKSQSASIAALRALPADELRARWVQFAGKQFQETWPIVDGWVIPRQPARVFAEHKELRIPLMTGSNAREGFDAPADEQLPHRIAEVFAEGAGRAAAIYPADAVSDPVLGTSGEALATDIGFRCPAVVMQGWHAEQGAPTYGYHFEGTLPGRSAIGSQHSDEVSYVFGTLDMLIGKRTPDDMARLSVQMVAYWANFARNGDPNGPGLPKWPRFTNRDEGYLRLATGEVVANPRHA